MRTHSHRLLAASFVALLATFGTGTAQARLAGNGVQTNGIQQNILIGRIIRNGPQTNGIQQNILIGRIARNGTQASGLDVNRPAGKAPVRATRVVPQAATVTLPDGTTLPLR